MTVKGGLAAATFREVAAEAGSPCATRCDEGT